VAPSGIRTAMCCLGNHPLTRLAFVLRFTPATSIFKTF
jgi:hypothetical protein